jgi:hypothetical protein
MSDNRTVYKLKPSQHDDLLFFRLEGEAAERYGSVGHLRVDFGRDGRGFWATWFDNQPHLKTPAFKAEFDAVINSLRDDGPKPPFANRANMEMFMTGTPGKELALRGGGYVVETPDFSYYFRCCPRSGDYEVYCFAFDNNYLLPELAGNHELPRYCFSILPSSGEMIRIEFGEKGYHRCNSAGMTPNTIRAKVNSENELRHVTRGQEEAMLAGSLFGWGTPAARPWKYDKDGNPRPAPPRKDAPER